MKARVRLEGESCPNANDPSGRDTRHLAELRAIGGVAVRIIELRVIKDVEELRSEIHVHVLGNRESLQDREISVADMRSATFGASGSAEGSEKARLIAAKDGLLRTKVDYVVAAVQNWGGCVVVEIDTHSEPFIVACR